MGSSKRRIGRGGAAANQKRKRDRTRTASGTLVKSVMPKDATKSLATTSAAARLIRADERAGRRNSGKADTPATSQGSVIEPPMSSGSRSSWGKVRLANALTGKKDLMSLAKASIEVDTKERHRLEREERLRYEREHAVDQLTDFQIEEFREAFRVFDVDGSGNIDKDELRKLMLSVGQAPEDDELEEMVRIADADGSGEVDFYEFVVSTTVFNQPAPSLCSLLSLTGALGSNLVSCRPSWLTRWQTRQTTTQSRRLFNSSIKTTTTRSMRRSCAAS